MMLNPRRFLFCLCLVIIFSPARADDKKYLEYQRLLSIADDSTKCAKLMNYADVLTDSLYDYDFAFLIYQKVNTLLDTSRYPGLQADLYFKWAFSKYKKGNYEEADKLCLRALALKQLDKNLVLKAKVLNVAGANLQDLGAYKRALVYYNEALAIYTKLNDNKGKSTVYQNMANIFALSGDLAQSDKFFDKAAALFLQQNLMDHYATVISNKSYIRWKLGYPDSAKVLLLKAIKIKLKVTKSPGHIIEKYFNLGLIYADLKRWDSCFFYLQKGKDFSDSLGIRAEYQGRYDYNTGYSYNLKGDYPKAISYFKKALNNRTGIANYSTLYENIAGCYYKNKQYDSALVYKTFGAQLADSLYKSELKEQIAFENKRVELLEKDYANEIQSSLQKQSLNELKNRNYLFVIIITLLVAFLVLLFFYFRQYRIKIKEEHLQSELDFLRAQLNPHFLFNSINNIYVLLDENKEKASEVLLKFSALMRYQLYECNVSLIQLDRELQFLENYIEFEKLRYAEKIAVDYHFEDAAGEGLYIAPLLLQPFIENAFKHIPKSRHSQSNIYIHAVVRNKTLLFELSNTLNSSQASTLPGGIGLGNVKKRLNLLYFNKHELHTGMSDGMYKITLNLKLAND